MNFLAPGVVSAVVGIVLGVGAVIGVTAAVQDNTRPDIQQGDPKTFVLNQVEYGSR